MKRLIILFSVFFLTLSVKAQIFSPDAKQYVGLLTNIQFDSGYTNFGLGAKYLYSFTDQIRGEVNGSYFFKKGAISEWDMNINAQYLFPVGETGLKVYPIAGVGILGLKWDTFISHHEVKFCENIGGGAEFPINDFLSVNGEFKMRYCNNGGRALITIGVTYTLN